MPRHQHGEHESGRDDHGRDRDSEEDLIGHDIRPRDQLGATVGTQLCGC